MFDFRKCCGICPPQVGRRDDRERFMFMCDDAITRAGVLGSL